MEKLSEHFTFQKLLRFTFPSIGTILVTSIYGIVDGFFVSNFVGKTPFAALNFVMPFLMILTFIGFLFGTGGGALIAKTLGEGKQKKANEIFSMLVYLSIALGIFFMIVGLIFIGDIAKFLGASGELLELATLYGRIVLVALPLVILQFEFHSLFSIAEKPQLGFYVTIASGVTNIFLDAILIVVFDMGLVGAALATAFSESLGGIIPLIYFARKNSSLLKLTRTHFDGSALFQTCTNGISEVVTSIAMPVVGMLYNFQLLKYIGEDGVVAYGIIMYVNLIFQSVFIGYSVGASAIVGYNFGAKNYFELKSLLKKSLMMIGIFAVLMFASAEIFAEPLAKIFVGYDKDLTELTIYAFRIYSISFLLSGFTIFADAFFTALNNGIISATISFTHTFIFETSSVIILPMIFGLSGIWAAIVIAEIAAVCVSIFMLSKNRRRYKY